MDYIPLMQRTLQVFVISTVFTVLRYSFQYLVKLLLIHTDRVPADKRLKFSESTWKFCYYVAVAIWGFQVVVLQDFFWDTKLCWKGWPNISMTTNLQWFYLVQLSFYVHSAFAHTQIEVRRSDYMVMLIHHIVSAVLIAFSYYHSVHRIGALILVLHDINDVILELSKLTNYTKGAEMISNVAFGSLIIVWGITRMYLFPTKVLGSIYYEIFEVAPEAPGQHYRAWQFFVGLLVVLQLLNIYWFFLILRIAKNTILGQALSDEREKDD